MFGTNMKSFDRVRTKHKFWGRHRRGEIQSINGGYIYVRLNYKNILMEFYHHELELI